MKIKVFYPNEKGNIEITKEKLESLLNEAYGEGYRDGKNSNGYYYCSSGLGVSTTPYITTCTDNAVSNCTADIAYLNSTTPSIDRNEVSTIDCYINTNDGITADILEGKPKNAIMVEYAEAVNEA